MARVGQRFKRHPCGERTVANDGADLARVVLRLGGQGHAQRCRNGSAGVANAKGVVFGLCPAGKRRQAAVLANAEHGIASPGEDFMRVGLMTHVPHQAVFRRVKGVVQRDTELNNAQACAKVATRHANAVEQVGAQLIR